MRTRMILNIVFVMKMVFSAPNLLHFPSRRMHIFSTFGSLFHVTFPKTFILFLGIFFLHFMSIFSSGPSHGFQVRGCVFVPHS